ncbi:uncharacterized protein Dwil_GK15508 [Drosophila willistoni]|uniref:Thioredoxin domain-containing protein n=1 Tax=Drosophila willistoni TaxID=7260 RepID=B4MWP1_DROWI|nr:endoplasmic reticulum resident protein 44-like [Drosophila willistoni]EDW76530.1 uncharacterized protein Dwil_GK15508 [Drosophila willistoni]
MVANSVKIPTSNVKQITKHNINTTIYSNEVVLLNFYADWCQFSVMLTPIFERAASQLAEEMNGENGKIQLGRVDCVKEKELADRYDIRKFPTLRLFYRGQDLRQEYRGKRSSEAIVKYVKSQLRSAITEIHHPDELAKLDTKRRAIIGYFNSREQPAYKIFEKMTVRLMNYCDFYMRLGADIENPIFPRSLPALLFRPDIERTHGQDEIYEVGAAIPHLVETWAFEKCVPLVREVDFNNVEELIEQKLPLLLLLHSPNDLSSIKDFKAIVEMQLSEFRGRFNFITVDGLKFEHSVQHMGKSRKDLPIIAIDSLHFMYPFSHFKDMYIPGKLQNFLQEFSSQHLREKLKMDDIKIVNQATGKSTTLPPPLSTFKNLGPSKHRYTLLHHDEL